MAQRIHILGASGCGVTTLGRAVADSSAWPYHDTDDFYWQPTDPPFRAKRPPQDRLRRLFDALMTSERWILGGALDGWGDALIGRFDLVVFLEAPTDLRLARLRNRERLRFGDRVADRGDMHEHHERFIAWADAYETVSTGANRSRARHEAWLSELPCRVLRLDARKSIDTLRRDVQAAL